MTTPEATSYKPGYRKDIDGLRALAVISVIINHLNHAALPGGYLGVDVFFVISGYVITMSLESSTHASLGDQLRHFYSRRIKRLMPALLMMAVITAAVVRLFDPNAGISAYTGLASIIGLANFFLFSQATNYFGRSAQLNAFSHTWSLGVEEQFYLLYPFLIRKLAPRAPNAVRDDRFRVLVLTLISVLSFLAFVRIYGSNQPAAYFLMPFRFWELGVGCLLALIIRVSEIRGIGRPFRFSAAIPLLAMIPALLLAERFPVASTTDVVIATAFLIGSARSGTFIHRCLSSRLACWVGSISYSLYLWHWPVVCISHWTIGIHLWSLPFQIAAIILLSSGSYYLVENPLRRAIWTQGRWDAIVVGPLAMAAAGLLILLGHHYAIPRFSGNQGADTTLSSPVPGYVARYSKRKLDDCFAGTVFAGTAELLSNHLIRCTAENHGATKLIFVGDSHATDLFPMADRLYSDGVASVLNISQPTCRVPPLEKEAPQLCGYPDLLLKLVASEPGDHILVIRNNYSPRAINGDLRDFSQRLDRFLARTSAVGLRVIYFAPSPKYYSVGADRLCSPQWYRPVWTMASECRSGFPEDRGEELARRRDLTNYLLDLSKKRTDFFVFDPFIVLCGGVGGDCTPMRGGHLIYRDESHITEQGSEMLVPSFEAFLNDHQLLGTAGTSRGKTMGKTASASSETVVKRRITATGSRI